MPNSGGRPLLVYFMGCCALVAAGALYLSGNGGGKDESELMSALVRTAKSQPGRLDELATETASLKVHALPAMKPWMLKLFEGAQKEQSRENEEQQKVQVEQREILSGKKDERDPFRRQEHQSQESATAIHKQDLDLITSSKKSAPFAQALEHVQSAKSKTIKIIERAKKQIIDLLNAEEKYVRQTASRAQTKYFDEGVIKVSDIDQHKSFAAKDNRRDSAREQETSEEVKRKPSREQPSHSKKDSNMEEKRETRKDGGESMPQSSSSALKSRDTTGSLMALSQDFDKGGSRSKQQSLHELLKIQRELENDYKNVIGKGRAARNIAKKFHLKENKKTKLGAMRSEPL
ncbi:hypothetical protein GUITHDRAFT_117576 [Guillardia theta CCMP2712]|uniref:Uncharacterized protein n=1 Tax=Guillardia theta (strain CCMP2712) TaxID=905079 RepID=L1IK90_GUITC|nr:hypothetical protein GUITHDRAFT_117576 [Guillardia theta CCMP2712]EKX36220.1 hypothetical protein GUITHDRAFT_117576 [Guillardia theta CCMP2712]|eukprot:XP_005823200.1 hypothetical protein GUITHDRAFT_117576 [Guillardia theta CCMP2712]